MLPPSALDFYDNYKPPACVRVRKKINAPMCVSTHRNLHKQEVLRGDTQHSFSAFAGVPKNYHAVVVC